MSSDLFFLNSVEAVLMGFFLVMSFGFLLVFLFFLAGMWVAWDEHRGG